jgi:hypothetical protein
MIGRLDIRLRVNILPRSCQNVWHVGAIAKCDFDAGARGLDEIRNSVQVLSVSLGELGHRSGGDRTIAVAHDTLHQIGTAERQEVEGRAPFPNVAHAPEVTIEGFQFLLGHQGPSVFELTE